MANIKKMSTVCICTQFRDRKTEKEKDVMKLQSQLNYRTLKEPLSAARKM